MRPLLRLLVVPLIPLLWFAGCSNQDALRVPSGPAGFRPTNVPKQHSTHQLAHRSPSDSANKSAEVIWVKVSMPEGPCEILMPGKPERIETPEADGSHTYNYRFIDSQSANAYYWVKFDDRNLATLNNSHVELLKLLGDGMVKRRPGTKLLDEKEIKYDGHTGYEFFMVDPDGFTYRTRIFIINQHQYFVMLAGINGDESVKSKDADKFFASFKVSAP